MEPGSNSVDVVIDLVAGDKWPQYLEALCHGGRYAVAGAIAGPVIRSFYKTVRRTFLFIVIATRRG